MTGPDKHAVQIKIAEQAPARPDTRMKILEAAEELFVRKGFAGTTVRDIAGAAGVNPALINYHFRSKEDLYKGLLLSKLTPMMQMVEDLAVRTDLGGSSKLNLLIDTYMEFVFTNPTVPRLVMREMTLQSELALWFASEFLSRLAVRIYSIIQEAEKDGYLREGINIGVAVPSFIGSIVFNVIAAPAVRVIQQGLGLAALDVEQQKREVKDVILKGIGKGSPSGGGAPGGCGR
jgi:AcrR family transcriptional regulator